jgi:hypothetical protein
MRCCSPTEGADRIPPRRAPLGAGTVTKGGKHTETWARSLENTPRASDQKERGSNVRDIVAATPKGQATDQTRVDLVCINNTAHPLRVFEDARREIAGAETAEQVKRIVAMATGLAAAARKATDRDLEAEAQVLKMEAERKLGQLMAAQKTTIGVNKGGRPKTGFCENPVSEKPATLTEAGIDKNLAHRARKAAAMTSREFEAAKEAKRETVRTRTNTRKTSAAPESKSRITHINILAVWNEAPPEERTKAVDAIGLDGWSAPIPDDWWPLLEKRVAERRRPPAPAEKVLVGLIPDDLSIPQSLRPEPPASADNTSEAPNTDSETAPEADEFDEDQESEPDEFEEWLQKRRNIKLIEHTTKIADAVSEAFSDLEELAGECREIVDNASEGLQATQRIQTLEASADELENLEPPEVPAALGELRVTYSLPKRRYTSRMARASNATTKLEACAAALQTIRGGDEHHAEAQALMDDLRSAIDPIECCEFPGMYG